MLKKNVIQYDFFFFFNLTIQTCFQGFSSSCSSRSNFRCSDFIHFFNFSIYFFSHLHMQVVWISFHLVPPASLKSSWLPKTGNGYEIVQEAKTQLYYKHCCLLGFVVWAVDLSNAPDVRSVNMFLDCYFFLLCPHWRGSGKQGKQNMYVC